MKGTEVRTYYIVFDHQKKDVSVCKQWKESVVNYEERVTNMQSWRIRNTKHNMGTSEGLKAMIEELDEETGNKVTITYWRELNV